MLSSIWATARFVVKTLVPQALSLRFTSMLDSAPQSAYLARSLWPCFLCLQATLMLTFQQLQFYMITERPVCYSVFTFYAGTSWCSTAPVCASTAMLDSSTSMMKMNSEFNIHCALLNPQNTCTLFDSLSWDGCSGIGQGCASAAAYFVNWNKRGHQDEKLKPTLPWCEAYIVLRNVPLLLPTIVCLP